MIHDDYWEETSVNYLDLADETIIESAKKDDREALEYLIYKYKNFVKMKARPYYLIGGDKEDIIQEGMIGLFKAIRDFNEEKDTTFKHFADICITRQMITAIKTATRQKHIPLNSYISFNKPLYDKTSERTLEEVVASMNNFDPEELIIGREEFLRIEKRVNETLSDLELEVFRSYVAGLSYQEIADEMDRHIKSVDNALQRVKKKLEKALTIKD